MGARSPRGVSHPSASTEHVFGTRIGALRTAVDGMLDADPSGFADRELRDELVGSIAQIDRLLGHVARVARLGHIRGIGAVDGSWSTAAWLRRNTGLRHGEARGRSEAGDACAGPPAETGRAWRAGEITATAARTIVAVGRETRVVSRAQRRALTVRDGGCRFPGRHRPPAWCDAHHVVHWCVGGRTDLENLILLCDHHHHLVHRTGRIVKFDGHEAHFLDPKGIVIRGP